MSSVRVVITGLGAITPLGLNVSQMWDGLSTGRCGIDTITAFDPGGFTCRIAGQTPEFKIQKYVLKSHRKQIKLMSRDIMLSIVAAKEALESSGLITKGIDTENVNVDPERFGINIGSGMISCELVELAPAVAASITDGNFDIRKWGKDGVEQVTPLWLLKYLPNMLACHLSIIHDIRGPSNTITCAEASAHIAITEAAQVIERGGCDIALAGAAEAKINPIIMIRQCLLKRTNDNSNDDPSAACRPFDANANGCIFAEAGGIVILESLGNARDRSANILAEFAGAGHSNSIN
ncbi:MAG: beta-ketoacyl-[acyl-carrier-protein] synthase family protein, partial [Planctomycetota bacterium]